MFATDYKFLPRFYGPPGDTQGLLNLTTLNE